MSVSSSSIAPVAEIWREPPGFPGYLVSNTGKLKLKNGKISQVKPQQDGYIRISLIHQDGRKVTTSIHRLVAETFLEKSPGKDQVDHKNGKRSENYLANLEWVTGSENSIRRLNMHGRTSREVVKMDDNGNFLCQWSGVRQAGDFHGFNMSSISRACNSQKVYKGFQWRYLDLITVSPNEKWAELHLSDRTVLVSSIGRVKTLQALTFGSDTAMGYKMVGLKVNGKYTMNFVHRLVARAFIHNPNWESLVVNHKSNVHNDNRVENLEWCTQKENMIHAVDFKTNENSRAKAVCQMADDGVTVKARFRSINEAAKQTDVDARRLSRVCKGIERTTKDGSVWRFAADVDKV